MDSEKTLPLLDGLNEVAPAHRDGCVNALNDFRATHGLVQIVVCSRIAHCAALTSVLRVKEAVELQPPTHPWKVSAIGSYIA